MKKNRPVLPTHRISAPPALIFLLIFLGGIGFAEEGPMVQDAELSKAYVGIYLSLQDTQGEKPAELLDAALEFDARSSDPYYLKARRLIESGEVSLHKPKELVETALKLDQWSFVSRQDVMFTLAGIYDRLTLYDKLYTLMTTAGNPAKSRGDWYYYTARSIFFTGNYTRARAVLREGSRRYPEHKKILLMLVTVDSGYRAFLSSAALDPRREPPSEEVLGRMLSLTPHDSGEQLFERYRKLGYDDPKVVAAMAAAGLMPNEWSIEELLGEEALGRADVFADVYQLFNEAGRLSEFEQYLSSVSVNIRGDHNGDGYDDTLYRMNEGVIQEIHRDYDQDGIDDIRVTFFSGEDLWSPNKLYFGTLGSDVEIIYRSYPEVERLIISSGSGTAELAFSAGAYRYDPLEYSQRPPLLKTDLPSVPNVLDLQDVASNVSFTRNGLRREKVGEGEYVEKYEGVVTRKQITDGEILIDRDIDGDGYFEIQETYRNGELYSIILDNDKDGIYEYRRFPQSGIEEWNVEPTAEKGE